MSEYRVSSDPSWRVERLHRGQWRVAFFCSSRESAEKCLERCRQRAMEWARMTNEERMKSVLR